jgi:hypothetical protein
MHWFYNAVPHATSMPALLKLELRLYVFQQLVIAVLCNVEACAVSARRIWKLLAAVSQRRCAQHPHVLPVVLVDSLYGLITNATLVDSK